MHVGIFIRTTVDLASPLDLAVVFGTDVVLCRVGACPVGASAEEKREKVSLGTLGCF